MNSEQMKIEEPDLLREVPPILKRLAKTVAYALYEPDQVVTLCLLTKYPCIDEDSLMERLQFDKRQMRQVLNKLKNDRLVKMRVVKEKVPETGGISVYNFYFINYNLFVNVVKYRLDHMRKKLENEEQQAKNRPSFQCLECAKTFSDLEVDRLIDFATGLFKCTFCNGMVEEDESHIKNYSNGSSLAKFNEQLETIFKLLRQCENINLAPEILEPTPSTAALKASAANRNFGSNQLKSAWSTDRKSIDIYDQKIQINVGEEVGAGKAKAVKELPVWMSQSTVFNEEKSNDSYSNDSASLPAAIAIDKKETDNEIMSDLLAHETASKKMDIDQVPTTTTTAAPVEHNSSDSEADSDFADVPDQNSGDEDEEITVKVSGANVPLSDVTDDVIAKMTSEEHDQYLKLYNEHMEQFY